MLVSGEGGRRERKGPGAETPPSAYNAVAPNDGDHNFQSDQLLAPGDDLRHTHELGLDAANTHHRLHKRDHGRTQLLRCSVDMERYVHSTPPRWTRC